MGREVCSHHWCPFRVPGTETMPCHQATGPRGLPSLREARECGWRRRLFPLQSVRDNSLKAKMPNLSPELITHEVTEPKPVSGPSNGTTHP